MGKEKLKTQKLKDVVPGFEKFLDLEGQEYKEERADKEEFLDQYFSGDNINSLDEGTLRELIGKLWAFSGFTNKDYLLKEMLKTDLEVIRGSFHILLFSDRSLEERFNYAKERVRMLGAGGISELLSHFNPQKYPIWNRRAREGLFYLGIPENEIPKSTQISGAQYKEFSTLMRKLLKETKKYSERVDDLLSFDFLLFYISSQEVEKKELTEDSEEVSVEDFDHDTVIDQVLELGDGLGFEVEKELNVARGCRVDAIWRSRIANIGTISYAFEIHRHGSRDSAILNLQRVIRQDPSIRKVVLVSSQEELNSFKEYIDTLGEDFRNAVGYFTVDDLQVALKHLGSLQDILEKLGLMNIQTSI